MNIEEALKFGPKKLKSLETPTLDVEVLLVFAIKKDKSWLFSNLDYKLSDKQINKYKKLISRRKKGWPIAYITGHKEFYGLDFKIDKNVLIPRPETEMIVELALDKIKNKKLKIKNIIDLGTGSGAIAISITKNIQITNYKLPITIYASDISTKALEIARKNAKKHKVLSKIKFIKSDLLTNLKSLKFDLIIANLPYLEPELIDKKLRYEPQKALNGGKNGLEIIEKFLQETNFYLSKNGIILIEIDPRQKNKIKKLAERKFPNKKITLKKDLAGLDRLLIIG